MNVCSFFVYSIGVVMAGVLSSSTVDRRLEPRTVLTRDYNNGICLFSITHTGLRSKYKDWLHRNQDNVPEWNSKRVGLV